MLAARYCVGGCRGWRRSGVSGAEALEPFKFPGPPSDRGGVHEAQVDVRRFSRLLSFAGPRWMCVVSRGCCHLPGPLPVCQNRLVKM